MLPHSRGFASRSLAEFLQNAVAFEAGQVIDEENPVQMIDLVLDARRENAVRLDFLPFAMAIEVSDADARRPLDLLVIFRDRKAAFLINSKLFRSPEDLRIGKAYGIGACRIVFSLGDVDHNDPPRHANLDRGQSEP